MAVTRHTDPRAFLAAAAPTMARSATTASVLASAVDHLLAEPPPPGERLYLATFDDGASHGAAVQRRENAVRIEDSDVAAAIAFAHDLASDWPRLQGVVGRLEPCEAFARAWREATGRAHALRMHLRSHLLTEVADVARAPGAMRAASEADVDWLADANARFIREARMPPGDLSRARLVVALRVKHGDLRVWEDGEPVAFAGCAPAGPGCARIAPVWTDPDARGRGYATALVAHLAREMLARGRRSVFLDTDVSNPTSNAIYARIGFRPLADFYHFDFVEP